MVSSIMQDRAAQLLLLSYPEGGYDTALIRLEKASIKISAGDAAYTPWGQAALLTLARCAVRMFRGGVYLSSPMEQAVILGNRMGMPLSRILIELGCRVEIAPDHAASVYVGGEDVGNGCQLRCWADGWSGITSPRSADNIQFEGNEIGGSIAGALAASELFRMEVLGDVRAGKRIQRVSALCPSNGSEAEPLEYLPSKCWLLGLGNLGQATLWILSLLPYRDPFDVSLYLQDVDISGLENLDIQILTTHNWVGRKKTRAAAEFAEGRGFGVVISERRFAETSARTQHEPGLLFCGVDNLDTRRIAAQPQVGFDLVIDAGLGGSASEIFDIRIHSFPGFKSPTDVWPHQKPAIGERSLPTSLDSLVKQGRLNKCGALSINETSVGVPSTAVVAAAIQVGQACRAIATSQYCDLVDISLRDTSSITIHQATLNAKSALAYQKSFRAK